MKGTVFVATLALASLAFASATPECFLLGSTLWVTDADSVGAKCYHYASEDTCECDSGPTTYADGQSLTSDGWDTVHVDPRNAPYHVNLYTGDLMVFPGDKCCPPPTFVGPSVPCETVSSQIGRAHV